ncbi:MAG: DNA repair protein RecO [Bacteroidales bacterium]|nr:DNA repair protein RecO [Bacteroidales bacterium]
MLEKTEGIVLHTIKHSDSGIISHVYTKKYGRLSLMAKGISSRKGTTRRAYFQVLQALDIEFYYREKRDLHIIREATPLFNYVNLHSDYRKNSILMFLGEILYKALRPAGPDEQLFSFLIDSLDYLDNENSSTSNFHIGFIIGLTKYLGIAPSNNHSSVLQYFDMQNGVYTDHTPLHAYYMGREYSLLLNAFLKSDISECNSFALSGNTRREFLNDLLGFYSLHLPGFQNIQSLKIYTEIFNAGRP